MTHLRAYLKTIKTAGYDLTHIKRQADCPADVYNELREAIRCLDVELSEAHKAGEHVTSWAGCPVCES